jgi:hypothetical protein
LALSKEQRETGEKDVLYVLRREDGSIVAELMLTPSMAVRINERRRKAGILSGDWVPQDVGQYGLWHLETEQMVGELLSLTIDEATRMNKAIPKDMGFRWKGINEIHGTSVEHN